MASLETLWLLHFITTLQKVYGILLPNIHYFVSLQHINCVTFLVILFIFYFTVELIPKIYSYSEGFIVDRLNLIELQNPLKIKSRSVINL